MQVELPSSGGRIIFGLSMLFRCFHGRILLRLSLGSLQFTKNKIENY